MTVDIQEEKLSTFQFTTIIDSVKTMKYETSVVL